MIQKHDLARVHLNLIPMLVDKEKNENNIRQPLQLSASRWQSQLPARPTPRGLQGVTAKWRFEKWDAAYFIFPPNSAILPETAIKMSQVLKWKGWIFQMTPSTAKAPSLSVAHLGGWHKHSSLYQSIY